MSDKDYIKSIEEDNEKLRAKIAQLEEELHPYRKSEEEKSKYSDKLLENSKKWMESIQQSSRGYADAVAKDLANVQPMSNHTIRDILKAYMNDDSK